MRTLVPLLCAGCTVLLLPARSSALGTRPEPTPSLRKTLAPYGFARPVVDGTAVRVANANCTLVFTLGSRKLSFNDVLVLMNGPLIEKRRRHYLAAADVHGTLHPLLTLAPLPLAAGVPRVLLDPGHGGGDTGAIGRQGIREKDIVLDIARRACGLLRDAGIATDPTRHNDTAVPLALRPEKAGLCGADLMVSIHLNSSGNPAAAGIETYLAPAAGFPSSASNEGPTHACPGNRFDPWNMRAAYALHKELLARTGSPDRGIRRARYVVLRDAPCPAVLVECGFLSNAAEESRISRPEHRQAIAEGVARGILGCFRPTR